MRKIEWATRERARFVKLVPLRWRGAPSLRAGLLVPDVPDEP